VFPGVGILLCIVPVNVPMAKNHILWMGKKKRSKLVRDKCEGLVGARLENEIKNKCHM